MSSTSRSAKGSRAAARSVLALRAIGRTAAIARTSEEENPKSIRTRVTPIDRRNSHGESPSSRAVLGETSATTVSPEDAEADTIAVAAARVPEGVLRDVQRGERELRTRGRGGLERRTSQRTVREVRARAQPH